MTDPLKELGDDAWLALFALRVGDTIEVVGGDPCAVLSDGRGGQLTACLLADTVLDRVEDAGFVEHVGGGLALTPRGKYWVEKWLKRAVGGKGRGRLVLPGVK